MIAELIYRTSTAMPCASGAGFWGCFFDGSFLRRIVFADSNRITAFGALLLPVALMLGFLLNTAIWFCLNDRCRGWADRTMDGNLRNARTALESDARFAFGTVIGEGAGVPRVHLSDFYLTCLDLDKLTFLRESYFSWFEFHFNSVAALTVTTVAYAVTVVTLALRWSLAMNWLTHLILPCVLMAGLGWFLAVAGLHNLRRYQEGFVWLLVGTLHFRD